MNAAAFEDKEFPGADEPWDDAAERAVLTDTGGWGGIAYEAELLAGPGRVRVEQAPVVMDWAALDWSRGHVGTTAP